MWCLHGRVKALNFLSRLSLRQWCQALAEKKDDFINDLINHQNSPSPHIPLLFILLAHHSSFSFFQSLISHTHIHIYIETHTCSFSRHCNTSSLVLSLSSPDFNLLPPRPVGSKSPEKQCHHYSGGIAFSELPPQKDNCLSACPELRKIIA